MPRIAAPKNDTSKPADHLTVVSGTFSNNDLLAITKRPQHAPQVTVFTCKVATAGGIAVVFRQEGDAGDTTATVPPNGVPLVVNCPIKLLVSGGADVEAHCYWWAGSSIDYNK